MPVSLLRPCGQCHSATTIWSHTYRISKASLEGKFEGGIRGSLMKRLSSTPRHSGLYDDGFSPPSVVRPESSRSQGPNGQSLIRALLHIVKFDSGLLIRHLG